MTLLKVFPSYFKSVSAVNIHKSNKINPLGLRIKENKELRHIYLLAYRLQFFSKSAWWVTKVDLGAKIFIDFVGANARTRRELSWWMIQWDNFAKMSLLFIVHAIYSHFKSAVILSHSSEKFVSVLQNPGEHCERNITQQCYLRQKVNKLKT